MTTEMQRYHNSNRRSDTSKQVGNTKPKQSHGIAQAQSSLVGAVIVNQTEQKKESKRQSKSKVKTDNTVNSKTENEANQSKDIVNTDKQEESDDEVHTYYGCYECYELYQTFEELWEHGKKEDHDIAKGR